MPTTTKAARIYTFLKTWVLISSQTLRQRSALCLRSWSTPGLGIARVWPPSAGFPGQRISYCPAAWIVRSRLAYNISAKGFVFTLVCLIVCLHAILVFSISYVFWCNFVDRSLISDFSYVDCYTNQGFIYTTSYLYNFMDHGLFLLFCINFLYYVRAR